MRVLGLLFLLAVLLMQHCCVECKKGKKSPVIGSYKNRRKCPYFQQSGCFLTILENVCDFYENPEDFGQAKLHLLIQSEHCCCPEPFKECRELDKDERCVDIFAQVMDKVDHEKKTYAMTLKAFNDVRRELLKQDENCGKYLSTRKPVQCDNNGIPPFKLQQHQCEQLYWIYEELGIDNQGEMLEAKCPFKRKYRASNEDDASERILHPVNDREEEEAALTDTSPQLYRIASYTDRRKCPYWQQSGCFLDELEKICEDTNPLTVLQDQENVFLCCCPKPYKACKRSEADQKCLKTLEKHLSYTDEKKIDKDFVMHGVQAARSELLSQEHGCHSLATPIPFVQCSKEPAATPFTRHDVICEMLSWQWEELGDGNKGEFGKIRCPFIEKDMAPDVGVRKGALGFLSEHEIHQPKTEL